MNITLLKDLPLNFNTAQLSFTENSEPHSTMFDDVYFSDCGGMKETEHVFISGNNLEERLIHTNQKEFVIGETGFGTGLNLLTLMNRYKNLSNNHLLPHINFLTVEAFPLSFSDMEKAHQTIPEIKEQSQKLLNKYCQLKGGLNVLEITPNFTLYLLIGDVEECFSSIDTNTTTKVDAWFLDGFAPSQNTAIWSNTTAKLIAKLSKPQTTLATFTVAGFVRRNLLEAGFKLTKVPGFGRKKEMLTGTLE